MLTREQQAYANYAAKAAASGINVFEDPTWAGQGIVTPEQVGLPSKAPMAPVASTLAPVGEISLAGVGTALATAGTTALGAVAGALPAGVAAALPAVGGALLAGGGIYGILQAMGLGEGEGLFGIDILGGDTQYMDGIPFGGPGLAEPPAEWVEKEWHVNYDWGRLQYYLVKMPTGGRKIAMYNTRTKKWKIWRWRKPYLAVIGKNMPSHRQLTRLKRNLNRHTADARTILRISSPASYAKMSGYRKVRGRRR